MSLYEYVQSKEDVLDLALDEVIGEIEMPGETGASEGAGAWRDFLIGQLTQSRAVMRRHPWVPALTATRPLVGPRALARSRVFYEALAAAGLEGELLTAAVGTLSSYVNGFVAAENIWWQTVRTPAADAEFRARVAGHLEGQLAQLSRVRDGDFDRQFLLGLGLILDGIEGRLGGAGP
ncbi:TetR/AcrR family transcriptional regulator [Nonomuraea sp. PA05]|uniref:TetR/AcrR family transcriptional regulator C-terminal domain-containing protein n=1 Tax=Nonomuraea sp. PA05 TaxID=2604466 RepID=UPI0011D897DA|nr:TetR/AcrR family transcriptional regulator C-terminal domain-containing protein [Nonomuraea sp. PA05]TYB61009.1 TetR/AcrR family transcriptional regulator [Nonomuraea sp. PA05]